MSSGGKDSYYIPDPSIWPITAVMAIFTMLLGLILTIHGMDMGVVTLVVGMGLLFYLFYAWFSDVIAENLRGSYNAQVDSSFRQGMFWFIASEVCFFLTFFGCLYYLREITLPYLGGEGQLAKSNMLWEGFEYSWPLIQLPDMSGTTYTLPKEAMGPWGIPFINTVILLSSGGTLTWAHWGLKNNNRQHLIWGLAATVALGLLFFAFQIYEYGHAYADLDLQLDSGIYGSTFYMLTGFHGLHVTIGTIMLIAILARCWVGHFSEHNHFAFEAVAWYWHFVDVVWIALFIFVYWL